MADTLDETQQLTGRGGLLPAAAVETAVKAGIRVVPSPGTRDEMWRRYRDEIARVAVADPRAMPWETACAVTTPEDAAAVCGDVLAAIPEGELRERAREVMVAALMHADGELAPDDGTMVHCVQCGRPFKPRNRAHRYCKPSCRQQAFARRQKAADAPAS
jgi:hypothetical protein